jgi:hypothetical protein
MNDRPGLSAQRYLFAVLLSLCNGPGLCGEAGTGLGFALGENGLTSLFYDDQQLLANGWSGNLRAVAETPKLQRADGAIVIPNDKPQTTLDAQGHAITQQYSWGVVECTYAQRGNRLRFDLRVTNTSPGTVILALDLEIVELTFTTIPHGRVLDAGMWGLGGGWQPLHEIPLIAKPDQMPPAVFVQFGSGTLAFTNDGDPSGPDKSTVAVPYTTNPSTKRTYPFRVSFPKITAARTARAEVSLRFGGPDLSAQELAGDVLQRFRDTYPYAVNWTDRRPIGALFLATSQKHPERNPRGWFLNATDVDVTTPEGLAKWRARLMKYADDSIKVLKDIDAQGMITWDPEGEEFSSATFYGDPRLTSRLAPETDFTGGGALGALDEYFQKFREAGLKTGITLRPQAIEFKDGLPFQNIVENPTHELLDKIAYARKRWGCTLFYVDSSYDRIGPLNADILKTIADLYPDVLLLPENENLRHFAYSAPLNSYHHHGVASTPASVREVYRRAFSGLMVTTTEDKMRAGHGALVDAVRRGDILIVNAWYGGKHTEFVKSIYREAGR